MVSGWAAAAVLTVSMAAVGALYGIDGPAVLPPADAQSAQAATLADNSTLVEITSQAELQRLVEASAARQSASWQSPPSSAIGFGQDVILEENLELASRAESAGSAHYSTTNIQVAGVDEPDYLKNDGEYLYVVSGDNVLSVIDLWPPDEAHTVLRTALDVDGRVNNMFLSGDRLVLFYTGTEERRFIPEFGFIPVVSYEPVTHALVVDISDRERPNIINDYAMEGVFLEARMIGDHAYFVTSSPLNYDNPRLPALWGGDRVMQTPRAFYFDDETSVLTDFITLVSVDVREGEASSETFLMGAASTFYVSTDNFYLAYQLHNSGPAGPAYGDRLQERFAQTVLPLLPPDVREIIATMVGGPSAADSDTWRDVSVILQMYYASLTSDELDSLFDSIRERQAIYDRSVPGVPLTKTVIHRIAIDGLSLRYEAKGEVPGNLHNQFSMDEHGSKLRVATTTDYRNMQGSTVRSNGVFVMDASLDMVGYLEGVAPGESIFSARFMGERLYLVTFRQIDPFFVIDLAKDNPRVLGELKLPGFSDYLHPYGDDYVIGVGRDTELRNGWVAQLGVKVAVFDVRDVSSPVVLDDHIIGKSTGTYSAAQSDHRAFFLDVFRGLLVVPIASNTDELGLPSSLQDGWQPWDGFYVFTLEGDGLDLAGTVDHSAGDDSRYQGFRTFYINDVLYTVSGKYVKMNDIDTLEGINSLPLGKSGGFIQFLE